MDEPSLTETLFWRVRAILRHAEALPAASAEPEGGMGSDEEENLFDQVEAADESLLGALLTVHPEWRSLSDREFEQQMKAVESRFAREQPPTKKGLVNLLEEACQLLDAAGYLSEFDAFPTGEDAEGESAWGEVAEAKEELESALHSLDPERHRQRLAAIRDPDERIEAAAQAEEREARSAAWAELNQRMRVLSTASEKFQAFEDGNREAAAGLREKLLDQNTQPDILAQDLVERTEMTVEEARTFIAYFRK